MRNKILSIIALASCMAVSAQETCFIKGYIADSQLADGKVLKKVFLNCTDEFGQVQTVASAKVKKGSYAFKCELNQGDPVMQYTITGFSEGEGITLFVEPGEILVNTSSATQLELSTVSGTVTNDAYAAYKAIAQHGEAEVARQIDELKALNGAAWLESAEGKREVKRIRAKETIKVEAENIRFLIEHNASPMTPWAIEHTLFSKLSAAYAEQMTKTIDVSLHTHPYYYSLRNTMLASTLKAGTEAPDITLPLVSGEVKHLTDYRGKHVILSYWTDAEKATEMFAELENVYKATKEQRDEYVIISISLADDVAEWKKTVKALGYDREGWLHACDGAGIGSPAAKRFGVENTPKIILVEPEGHAVSLDMEIDEMLLRIEQILSGDLYYLDMEK